MVKVDHPASGSGADDDSEDDELLDEDSECLRTE